MKTTIMNENKLYEYVKEHTLKIIKESQKQKELENQVAQEILGTPTFHDFYKNTGFWISARSYELMQRYFQRLKELTQEMEKNNNF